MSKNRLFLFGIIAVVLFAIFGGEDDTPLSSNPADHDKVLKVLAGSELKDVLPKLKEIERKTGIYLDFEFIGTLDGAEKIMNSDAYDLAWFSHAKYLSLLQGQNKRIVTQDKIGISPVIPAVKESLARRWGWLDQAVSWNDIAEKVRAGELRYAMSDPSASNSGFSTVMAVQAALSDSGEALKAEDINAEKLRSFFSGQELTSGSSGWLAEAYVRDQANLDGLFNYESVLLSMNAGQLGRLQEKLVLIYPQEGVVTADYPLMLLKKDKREDFQKLVDYFKSEHFQEWMMEDTNRRPVIAKVKPDARFPKAFLMDIPFPSNIDTVNQILFAYLDEQRRPSHSYFVLDVSGSMEGKRLRALKQALFNLMGDDQTITGKFARFRNREKVTVITFNKKVRLVEEFDIRLKDGESQDLQAMRTTVDSLAAKGGTAVYSALEKAYKLAKKAKQKDRERFYSVVLMSDGLSNKGITVDDFAAFYRYNQDYVSNVRTFPVLFADSHDAEMKRVATLTGGRVFDSRKHSLAHVFKKIRGYQ